MQSSQVFFAAMTLMKLFTFRGFGSSKKKRELFKSPRGSPVSFLCLCIENPYKICQRIQNVLFEFSGLK